MSVFEYHKYFKLGETVEFLARGSHISGQRGQYLGVADNLKLCGIFLLEKPTPDHLAIVFPFSCLMKVS